MRQMWMFLIIGSVLVSGALVGADRVAAQAPAGKKAAAKKWFEQGENHYRARDFRKALVAYKKAQTFLRHPAFLFNIAQCHRQLAEYQEALFYYKLYLSEQPNASNKTEVARFIVAMQKKATEIKAQRQFGKISIVSKPMGAEVRVDNFKGPPKGIAPIILKLKVGQHLIQLKRAGFQTVHKTVTVKHTDMTLVEVTLPKIAPRPRPRPLQRVTPPPRRRIVTLPPHTPPGPPPTPVYKRWWLWTGLAVGVAALATAAYTGSSALRLEREWENDIKPTLNPGDEDPIQDEGRRFAAVTDALIVVGVTALVATLIGAAVAAKNIKSRERQTRITPSCGPTGCGLSLSGSF